jgi:protein-tyrosine phosphatase
MTSILVVCTGNVCRSPMAEGFLRKSLVDVLGDAAPDVTSSGTAGWEGSEAMPEAVAAAAELGVDISAHRARRLLPEMAETADLVLCMAREHVDAIVRSTPGLAARTFTLKELVRLVERFPADRPGDVWDRVAAADRMRGAGHPSGEEVDDDVEDPLGLPLDGYRAVAAELDDQCGRLVRGLVVGAPAPSPGAEA